MLDLITDGKEEISKSNAVSLIPVIVHEDSVYIEAFCYHSNLSTIATAWSLSYMNKV